MNGKAIDAPNLPYLGGILLIENLRIDLLDIDRVISRRSSIAFSGSEYLVLSKGNEDVVENSEAESRYCYVSTRRGFAPRVYFQSRITRSLLSL